jgi:hypothetical protein
MLGGTKAAHPSASAGIRRDGLRRPAPMNDLIFIALSLAFFAIAAAYVKFCDRVR